MTLKPPVFIFFYNTLSPYEPSTYNIVLVVSIGVNNILKHAAVNEAPNVLIPTGSFLVYS